MLELMPACAPARGRVATGLWHVGRVTRLCAPVLVSICLAGCTASLGLPLGPDGDLDTASTIGTPVGAATARDSGLTPGDLASIGSALGLGVEGPLMWANPQSGAQGRVTNVASISDPDGTPCRSFDTTINAVDGLRAMHGIACRRADGAWTVDGLAPVGKAVQSPGSAVTEGETSTL